jgi:hypothetical protein
MVDGSSIKYVMDATCSCVCTEFVIRSLEAVADCYALVVYSPYVVSELYIVCGGWNLYVYCLGY